jgi:fatty-acyl-CoA synthase
VTTVPGLVHMNAARFGDREALVYAGRRTTWRQLGAAVEAAAGALHQRGLRHGQRCVLMAGNSDDFLVAVYAVFRLGAILVPISTRLAPPEVQYVITDSGAAMAVYDDAATPAMTSAAAGLEPAARPALATLAEVMADAGAGPGPAPDLGLVAEDDDALILYTSGTTGRPKGALLDHHREVWAGLSQAVLAGINEYDRYLHVVPLYHGAGITLSTAMLLGGATQVILPGFDPAAALAAIEQERITAMLGVPTMYQLMVEHPDLPKRDLRSWTRGIFGAAPMPASAVEKMLTALPDVRLVQECGQTEAGPAGIYAGPEQVRQRPDASGRQAMPFLEARVVGLDGAEVTGGGQVGELVLRGECMMKCYWRRPAETAEVIRDGWVYTGDLVRVDDDGFVTVVDRLKDMIITGGRNVYSVEVENAVAGHPMVADCAVVGRPHPQYGETIVAFATEREPGTLTLAGLREHCAGQIADDKLPRELIIAPIPRNASGKILKHELRSSLQPAPDAGPVSGRRRSAP